MSGVIPLLLCMASWRGQGLISLFFTSCKEGVWNAWIFREAMNEETYGKKRRN
jgi:hypothetical protein